MKDQAELSENMRMDMANRLFFRLYQCANMLHKTGSRAVESEGLSTQRWAVLGALSRVDDQGGMSVGDLARFLMMSRQNLAGLINRMARDGLVQIVPDEHDRRSRRVQMTAQGREVWHVTAQPGIRAFYDEALAGFSVGDIHLALHYLMRLLDNMVRLDHESEGESEDGSKAGTGRQPAPAAPGNAP